MTCTHLVTHDVGSDSGSDLKDEDESEKNGELTTINRMGLSYWCGQNLSIAISSDVNCLILRPCLMTTPQETSMTLWKVDEQNHGIYPPHDFGKGGISPPSNCRTVFF